MAQRQIVCASKIGNWKRAQFVLLALNPDGEYGRFLVKNRSIAYEEVGQFTTLKGAYVILDSAQFSRNCGQGGQGSADTEAAFDCLPDLR